MFDTIVESVLNEISAEDAYNKFYNFIDRDIFDQIVMANNGKFDKLVRFLMDAMKAKKIAYGDAGSILRSYNNTNNEVRMAVKTKFEKGEYEDPIDILKDIEFFEKNGVVTTKSIQKMGYGVLFDTNEEKLTYTTTYEANHHYYGNTSWCTASDRMGRYDAWLYFLYYLLALSGVDEVKNEYLDGNIGVGKKEANSALIQYINKEEGKIYQLQVYRNGYFGQICDDKDNTAAFVELGMSEEAKQAIYSNIEKIVDLTTQSIEKECAYQLTKEDSLKKRKDARRKKLYSQLEYAFNEKLNIVKQANEHLFNSNLLMNKEFVEKIARNSAAIGEQDSNLSDEYEEMLKSQGYVSISTAVAFENGFCAIIVQPSYGKVKALNTDFNLEDVFLDGLNYDPFTFLNYDKDDEIFENIVKDKDLELKSALIILDADITTFRFDGFRVQNVNRVINVIKFDTARAYVGGCFNSGLKVNSQAYLLYTDYEALPNIIGYCINGKTYLYSFMNGKTLDISKYVAIGDEDTTMSGSIKYFWCDGLITIIFKLSTKEKLGLIIDSNFNVIRTVEWCFINSGISTVNVFVLCDTKTKELFTVSRSGLNEVGKTLGEEGVTIAYRGREIRVDKNGNGYQFNATIL